jgi:hypothetical protein
MLISVAVREKLKRPDHNVTEAELMECFANRGPGECIDTRAWHLTDPPTRWFVAQTDRGRRLKVVYVFQNNGVVEIKSAYPATDNVKRIYDKYAV